MNVLLIGATGFTGSAILNEALDRGHEVTAVVRDPSKVTTTHDHLTVVEGDVTEETQLAELAKGKDAVLSAFNAGWTNPNLYEDFVSGFKSILEGVTKSGVKRLLIVGGAGSLEVQPGLQLLDSPGFPDEYRPGAEGARTGLGLLRKEENLDWSYLSPPIFLEPGEKTGEFRLGTESILFDSSGQSKVSVGDFAVAFVDELENPQHIRQRFTLAY